MKSRTKIVTLPANAVRIHPVAQRDLVPSKVRQLVAEMDLDALGTFHAVDYPIDGVPGPWIIDGQHRWQALMRHDLGDWEIRVMIHLDATDDRRACQLFLRLNNRAPVSPFDKFRNEVASGDPIAIAAERAARDRGLELCRTSGDGKVSCVNALKKLAATGHIESVLDTAIAAWGKTAAAVEGKLLEGLGLVFSRYGAVVDRPALIKKLSKYPGGATGIIGDARGLAKHSKASLARRVAATIIDGYNAGRRSGQLAPL